MEAGTAALALDPEGLSTIQNLALVHLMQGDLPSARAVVAEVPATVSQPDLVAYLGTYQDLYWLLTDEQQKLVLRLTPASFDGDRSAWASVLMQTYWGRGDTVRSRIYADSAVAELKAQLRQAPGNWQRQVLQGLALAYLGRKAEAIRMGTTGAPTVPMETDQSNGPYAQLILIRIYLLCGETAQALDHLEKLFKVPNVVTPQWTRIDPAFKSLQGNPRYEKLVAGG